MLEELSDLKQSYFLVILLIILLTGCSNDKKTNEITETEDSIQPVTAESNAEENKGEDEGVIVGPPLPTSLEELEQLPKGYTKYISTLEDEGKKLTNELTKNLPDISGNPTTEELDRYYEAILSVFQQDFIGPNKLINEMKFQSIGDPEIEDPRYQFKEHLNVMIILDASGSMANMDESQTRMGAAKQAITEFVKGLPKEANVGLRIYGHKGTGKDSDKALSCSSSELIYPLSTYNAGDFNQALIKVKPAGWTPIGLALTEAQKDLASFKGNLNTNIIYLVSDGISTCDDQPVQAAKALYASDITPIVNIIGFNVDTKGQKQLKEIATATEGSYQNVSDEQSLREQLSKAQEVAFKWKQWKTSKEGWLGADKTGNSLNIFSYHTHEYGKWVDERQQIGFTLTYLLQDRDKMSSESYDYLVQKNIDYHNWIEEEYDKLRDELKVINEKNYAEAMKALEEKYLSNTRTP